MGIESPSTPSEKDQLLPDDLKERLLEKNEKQPHKKVIKPGLYISILEFYEQRINFLLNDKRIIKNREIVKILKEFLEKYGSEKVYRLLVKFFGCDNEEFSTSELKERHTKFYKFSSDFSKVMEIRENDFGSISKVYKLLISYLESHKRYVEKQKKKKNVPERLGDILSAKKELVNKAGYQFEIDFSGGEDDREGGTSQIQGENPIEKNPESINYTGTPYENWNVFLETNEGINTKWKDFVRKIRIKTIKKYYEKKYSSKDTVENIVNQLKEDIPEKIFNLLYGENYNFKWKYEDIKKNDRLVSIIKIEDEKSNKAFKDIKYLMRLRYMTGEVIDNYLIPINDAIIKLRQEIEKYNNGKKEKEDEKTDEGDIPRWVNL